MTVSNSPAARQARVITALMLRDIRTRFFGHGLGYLIAIFWPVAHIVILLAVYWATGRTAPLGSSLVLYLTVSLAPVMAFMYPSRWIMISALQNRPLLHFPVVKLFDVLVARGLLESAAAILMAVTLLCLLCAGGVDATPRSSSGAMAAMGAAIFLGFSLGLINGIICLVFPLWVTGYSLVIVALYITSGVLFVPDGLPEAARLVVSWNPVLHGVEWLRHDYYYEGTFRTLDKQYMLGFGVVCVLVSLLLDRYVRGRLLRS